PTLDSRLLADPPHPLVPTCGRIPRLAGRSALEATRIDILPPAKERSKERDLRFRRRPMMNDETVGVRKYHPDSAVHV
ncbi:MAG: hypothetical protein WBF93_03720, partial [Pirellulales bacterium]